MRILFSGFVLGAAMLCSTASVAQVMLNEVVAKNSLSLVDVYGESPDWIELYNPTASPVDLTGWSLEDSGATWVFPSVSIAAGDYLLVMASDRNEVAAGGELHANFKLRADGEYVGLKDTIGAVQDEFFPAYPALDTDDAYGVDTNSNLNVLVAPTPGAANSGPAPQVVAPSVAPRVFSGSLNVALSTTPAFPIHFTLDGSRPTAASPVYTVPLVLTSTTTVRAVTNASGVLGSVSAFTYTKVDAALLADNSDLPLMIITSNEGAVNDTEKDAHILVIDADKATGRATLSDDARHDGLVTVKTRGSSSSFFPKKQFKLEFRREWDTDESREVNLLDLGKESHFVVNGPGYFDRAYIQNALIQEWGDAAGVHKLKWRFVELYLDDDGNGQVDTDDYYGLMLVIESIKIDQARLDLADLGPTDIAAPEVTGGYVVRVDRAADRSVKILDAPGGGDVHLYRPFSDIVEPQQLTYITQQISDFDTALGNPFYAANGADAMMDTQTWIDTWLLGILIQDPDMHRLSTYMYKDRDDVLFAGPMWDCDRCINSTDGRNIPASNLFNSGGTDPLDYFWWGELWAHDEVRARFYARYKQLRATVYSDAQLSADVDRVAAIIDEAYAREIVRWGSTGGYGSRYGGTLQGEIDAMKTWLTTRTAALDALFMLSGGAPVLTDPSDLDVLPGEMVSVQLSASDTLPIAYGAVDLPEGLTLDTVTGLISGVIEAGAPKHNDILVFATNSAGVSAEQTLTLTYQNTSGYWGDAAVEDVLWGKNAGTFRYDNAGGNLGTVWRDPAYNDAAWPEGVGGLGNGTNGDAVINTCFVAPEGASLYFRKTFNVTNVTEVVGMLAQFRYDDAAIVWLNGTEVYRTPRGNIPSAGEVPYDYVVTSGGPGDYYALVPGAYDYPGVGPVSVDSISSGLLVEGDNVIAAQVFNRQTSDDTHFDAALSVFRLANTNPTIDDPGAQTHVEAATVSVPLSGNDVDLGDSLSFSASGLPPGISVIPTTGEMVGVLFTPGVFTVTATLTDQRGGSDSVVFTWTVQVDTDGDGDPDVTDLDDDDDGTPDDMDAFPLDATEDTDTDMDGVGDNSDVCVNDFDNDVDTDGVCGDLDNCPAVINAAQVDADADGLGDACDICRDDFDNDIDADGVCGDIDNCPLDSNADQVDVDADDLGDVCDVCSNDAANDEDADGLCADVDNCPLESNAEQTDLDADGRGDVCDVCIMDADDDIDTDGLCADVDNCPEVNNPLQANADTDLLGDACDEDDDDDGVLDTDDNCVLVPNPAQTDGDMDGVGDACSNDIDGDGVMNDVDNCLMVANVMQTDSDMDGIGDACDLCAADADNDADDDGICGDVDNCPAAANADQGDDDDDDVGDECDPCPGDVLNDVDGDSVCGATDNCPDIANPDQLDSDDDGVGDACALGGDGDGDGGGDGDGDGDGDGERPDGGAGEPEPGAPDGGTDGDGDGCGCNTSRGGEGAFATFLLIGLAAFTRRPRRRNASAARATAER